MPSKPLSLLKSSAHVCYTAAGCLIHDHKVLLVKHKKLGIWLNPGGHIEENELPHHAAEREFWEETGLRVQSVDQQIFTNDPESEYLPQPFAVNLHWISQKNYQARLDVQNSQKDGQNQRDYKKQKGWEKGCEQHISFLYMVKPLAGLDFKQNLEETDGIAWFKEGDLADLPTRDNIRQEIGEAFRLSQQSKI